jgi:hypothetical protein
MNEPDQHQRKARDVTSFTESTCLALGRPQALQGKKMKRKEKASLADHK